MIDFEVVGNRTRELQLRWIDVRGVNTLFIPIDRTVRKVWIQGPDMYGDYIVEFIGVEKGGIDARF